ncbi:kinetochore Nuf2-like protein [Trifolium pratense]|uniref:Kinetochore Nuf2-like protein n=1 Tax=Trifolium pratense TaxID=57577 RepID=A0A2K3N428_TRIPR|nr:kinetochore Nuf2-like protein [Trifolium pratense]
MLFIPKVLPSSVRFGMLEEFQIQVISQIGKHRYLLHREDGGQLEFHSLEHLEIPDLHVGSVRIIKLYNKIKEMLNFVDLLKPDPHRIECFLDALLNLCLDRIESNHNQLVEIEIEKSAEGELDSMRIRLEKIDKVKFVFLWTFESPKHFFDLVVNLDNAN